MENKNCWFYVICFIIGLIGIVLCNVVAGWVLSIMWGWFIVPLGLPVIGIFHSLGIVSVFHIFLMGTYIAIGKLSNKYADSKNPEQGCLEAVLINFVMPFAYLVMLLTGWIYYSLMMVYPNF